MITFNNKMELITDKAKVIQEVIENILYLLPSEVWTFEEKGIPYFDLQIRTQQLRAKIYEDLSRYNEIQEILELIVEDNPPKRIIKARLLTSSGELYITHTGGKV